MLVISTPTTIYWVSGVYSECTVFVWLFLSVSAWNEAAGANLLHKAARTHPSAPPSAHQRPQTRTGEQPCFILVFLKIQKWTFIYFCISPTLCNQKLIRLCGEVLAAPTENEEIQFLCIVCAKLKQDPYLVNFFLEVSFFTSGGGGHRWHFFFSALYIATLHRNVLFMMLLAEQDKEAWDEGSWRVRSCEGQCFDSRHWSVTSKWADWAPRGATSCCSCCLHP